MTTTQRRLESIERQGIQAQGRAELIRHLKGEGKPLSFKQAIQAKCYECMGYYSDGRADCKVPDCPLYAYHPYREGGPVKTNPGRQFTEEQKEGLREQIKKIARKSNLRPLHTEEAT